MFGENAPGAAGMVKKFALLPQTSAQDLEIGRCAGCCGSIVHNQLILYPMPGLDPVRQALERSPRQPELLRRFLADLVDCAAEKLRDLRLGRAGLGALPQVPRNLFVGA